MIPDFACGEDGKPIPVEHFDYDAIDRNLFKVEPEELATLTRANIDMALKLMETVMRWIWQNGMRNTDGLQIRSMIACWIFIRELRPMTETELARAFGKDKQSIERWVCEFKESFPMIRTPHMKA